MSITLKFQTTCYTHSLIWVHYHEFEVYILQIGMHLACFTINIIKPVLYQVGPISSKFGKIAFLSPWDLKIGTALTWWNWFNRCQQPTPWKRSICTLKQVRWIIKTLHTKLTKPRWVNSVHPILLWLVRVSRTCWLKSKLRKSWHTFKWGDFSASLDKLDERVLHGYAQIHWACAHWLHLIAQWLHPHIKVEKNTFFHVSTLFPIVFYCGRRFARTKEFGCFCKEKFDLFSTISKPLEQGKTLENLPHPEIHFFAKDSIMGNPINDKIK